ncbi:hypothetical protein SAY87_018241 [Trapa incisa]|uniref:AT1G17665-like protein n=1 Tax=Trapa incisa TaxID=236973 RepID=A0AAN7QSL6_9MYRT|nr:hypothetical protein SAY87_018241 [Trapa incisa]
MDYSAEDSMVALLYLTAFLLTVSFLFISFSLFSKLTRTPPELVSKPAAEDNRPKAPQLAKSESEGGLGGDTDTCQDRGHRKKKKRTKKKSKKADMEREEEQSVDGSDENEVEKSELGTVPISQDKLELICLYPFTSSGSAIQRRIKQQYDQVVKSNESNGLTLAQVGQFANCLVEAKNELEHKSEMIHRRFSIAKALLLKSDRSSSNRVRQQIYKLELEKKRLEEDTFVYNWLQQQLKLSPAYKKMLEISACMELKTKPNELLESEDADLPDISFEDFLAQEKKDSFWQKLGKSRTQSG